MPGTRTARRGTGRRNTGSQSARQDAIYAKITNRILDQLREGTVPWRKKWNAAGGAMAWPKNFKSKKPYRGINPVILFSEPYTSPWWGSYGQWAKACGATQEIVAGRKVWQNPDGTRWAGLAGQTGTTIIFWRQIFVDTDEISPRTGRPVKKRIPMLHSYVVFNYEQVTGAPEEFAPPKDEQAPTRVQQMLRALEIHKAYVERTGMNFVEGGNRAFYDLHNTVRVPALAAYAGDETEAEAEYWSTVFHEDAHFSGHPSRLKRPGIENFDHFGSGQYSKEELAAEMSAAMLMAVAGIETTDTFTNSAAYIAGWLKQLDSDPKLVIQAAAQAQRAVDFILNVTWADDDDEEED